MWRFLLGVPRALRQQIQNNVRGRPACIEEEYKNKQENEENSLCPAHTPIKYICRFSSSKCWGQRTQSEDTVGGQPASIKEESKNEQENEEKSLGQTHTPKKYICRFSHSKRWRQRTQSQDTVGGRPASIKEESKNEQENEQNSLGQTHTPKKYICSFASKRWKGRKQFEDNVHGQPASIKEESKNEQENEEKSLGQTHTPKKYICRFSHSKRWRQRTQSEDTVHGRPACIGEESKNEQENEEKSVCQTHTPKKYTSRFSSKWRKGSKQSEDNGPEHENFNWRNLNADFWAQLHQGRNFALETVGWGAAVILGIHLSKLSHLRGDLITEFAKGKSLCCTLLYKVAFASPGPDGVTTQRNVLPNNKTQTEKLATDVNQTQPVKDEPNSLDLVFSEFEDLCKKYTATGNNIAGLQHAAQNNMDAAVHHWQEASKLGSSKAQFNLGLCYESGTGVERNISKAIKQYKLAANSDHAQALYNLALIYLGDEDETGEKTEKAIRWMEKSAELGLGQAQTYMGVYYTEGEKQNLKQAVSYFKSAAAQKDPEAEYFLGICFEQGWGVDQNECLAADYYKRSSDRGHDGAMYNLAVFHEFGLGGLPVNVEVAMKFYEKSSEEGNDSATHSLQRLQAQEATAEWKRQEFAETISQQSIKDTPQLRSPASSPSLTEYVREHLDQLVVSGTSQPTDYLPWIHVDALNTGRPFFTLGDPQPKTSLFSLGEPEDFPQYTGPVQSNLYSNQRGLSRPASLFDLQVACT